ncbi:MAG TPA: FixH family protein [Verrucomicrobiae bacterium]|nr:FixH family protein [Verrucomicrobiae bacterium]
MKPARNLWPLAIILTFALFISGTIGLVVMACSQKVELVNNNYYDQELRFQNQLDRMQRANQLLAPATVSYDPVRQLIRFQLPIDQRRSPATGRLELYRPSAAGLDQRLDLHVDSDGVQAVDASQLARGLWKIRVNWRVASQDYFIDQKIVIGSRT